MMPAFRVSGATGQAPTTAWFGSALPDRGFTMLMPGFFTNPSIGGGPTNSPYFIADNKSADVIANYVPFNTQYAGGANAASITLGATVTAPDGTSTANHIVETTINNFHAMTAIFPDGAVPRYRRFAVIAQAAERTRMFIAVCGQPGLGGEKGCRTVFDLSGGQIGVANTQYGTDSEHIWKAGAASITSLGSGWYLCIMDCLYNINISGRWLSVLVGPDAGSGTGALNISYAGDVTKGINVWKTNLLPLRAWALQNTVFFDDFNSLATIDLNNTQAPGFNWYVNLSDFPVIQNYALNPPNPNVFSVSNSILTMDVEHATNPSRLHLDIITVGHTSSPPNWIGTTWQPSALFEAKYAFDTAAEPAANGMAWWEASVETLLENSFGTYPSGTNSLTYQEIDFNEIQTAAGGNLGILSVFGDPTESVPHPGGQENIQSTRSASIIVWNPAQTYGTGSEVGWQGQLYSSLINGNINNQPDLTLGVDWQVLTPAANFPTAANTVIYDGSAQNTYAVLWLRDQSMYDPRDLGEFLGFLNGVLSTRFQTGGACLLAYGLSQGAPAPFAGALTKTSFTSGDREHIPMFIECSYQVNVYVDWAKVTQ